jgi:hypothetical protein
VSAFRDSIRAISSTRKRHLALAEISRTERVAEEISTAAIGSDAPKASKDYNRVALSIQEKVIQSGGLTRQEARDAAWCLWETTPSLASSSLIVASIIKATEVSRRRQPFRALASSYMTSYAPDLPALETISALLARLAGGMGVPWAPLQNDINLFHSMEGPQNLARKAVERRMSPTEVLTSYGLGAVSAQSGFAKHCIAQALQRMRDGGEPRHDARLQWITSFALRNERDLLFQEHGPLVADALLLPFGSDTPEERVTDKFLTLLLRLFGDPRVHPVKWRRMESAAAIVRRWLTKQSLRQFFEVVDQVALDRMWKYRRAFWGAVYDQELILDAWVVFGPLGATAARRTFGKEISFATFDGGIADKGHAVLLLRIGRGVVAEWSHNGRCVIWTDAGSPGAPNLHEKIYDAGSLKAGNRSNSNLSDSIYAVTHGGADSYAWQSKVAAKIHQMTGVRISQNQYQVT